MSKCNKCNVSCDKYEEHATCEGMCKSKYHFGCSIDENSYRKILNNKTKIWVCSKCSENSQIRTRLKSAKEAEEEKDPNINQEIKEMKILLANMNDKLGNMATIKTEIQAVRESTDFFSAQYDDMKKIIDENNKLMEALVNKVNFLQAENDRKDKNIMGLNKIINKLEQEARKKTVEVYNFPEEDKTTHLQQVQQLATKINIGIEDTDIEEVYRRPLPRNSKTKHKPLVIKFLRKQKQEEFVKQKKYNVRSNSGELSTIYINEQMSPYYRNLLFVAKEYCKLYNYKYVWFRGGKVLTRKTDTSKIIHIEHEDDLSQLNQPQ